MGIWEKRIYAGITLLAMAGLAWGGFWLAGTYIDAQVDKRLKASKPMYTLECRPKGEG